ncbi:hypothetical protein BN77_3460 [Rhizobium mesoamericanum STM3625]|uniref:Uncharacterized protein n=1 Tax=Rhizobium mesoamericanum STM3625 TaxID=1211777 RepID=K0PYC6_9HYPH|nr:hypothetical protein BN77_3460 [Rhizobium mesoamericanum STM3625]
MWQSVSQMGIPSTLTPSLVQMDWRRVCEASSTSTTRTSSRVMPLGGGIIPESDLPPDASILLDRFSLHVRKGVQLLDISSLDPRAKRSRVPADIIGFGTDQLLWTSFHHSLMVRVGGNTTSHYHVANSRLHAGSR